MRYLILALALLGCDGALDDPPAEPPEPRCDLPSVGDTCKYVVDDIAVAVGLSDRLIHCDPNDEHWVFGEVHDDSYEVGCQADDLSYRYPAGGWVRGWGFSYQSRMRALIRCDADHRVVEVLDLIQCGDWRGLNLDGVFDPRVEAGDCIVISEICVE